MHNPNQPTRPRRFRSHAASSAGRATGLGCMRTAGAGKSERARKRKLRSLLCLVANFRASWNSTKRSRNHCAHCCRVAGTSHVAKMPSYLSWADSTESFIRRCRSRRASRETRGALMPLGAACSADASGTAWRLASSGTLSKRTPTGRSAAEASFHANDVHRVRFALRSSTAASPSALVCTSRHRAKRLMMALREIVAR